MDLFRVENRLITILMPDSSTQSSQDNIPSESDHPNAQGDEIYRPDSSTHPDEGLAASTPPPNHHNAPTPPTPPALGTQGMPLPRKINEVDTDATRVTPVAYTPPMTRPIRRPAPASSPPPPPPQSVSSRGSRFDWRLVFGVFGRMIIIGFFLSGVFLLCLISVVLYQYYSIAATLPSVDDLRGHTSQFETTLILDRNGNVLYEILDPNAGRRTYVKLNQISPYLIAATLATEDKGFYNHPGFDPMAILRAFVQNYESGDTVSGASTITQQLSRTLLFTPEERSERTYLRKVREALLAAEVTRRYSKDEILELYLNEIYYGSMAYGIEAASQTYFGTSAANLTMGQASFLAGLPQAPSIYDIYTDREATLARHEQVLRLMFEASQEGNCIFVSNSTERVCVDVDTALAAYNEIRDYEFKSPDVPIRYPHWVTYVRSLLEAQYDPQTIYRSGFTIYTTLDPGLQDAAEQITRNQVEELKDHHATDGAMVVIRPKTGEILAMVGSADFYNEEIAGQVNMALSPRQPGSAFKPITYLAAFEKGWTPSSLIWDVPSEFPPSGIPDDPSPPYKPVNYDERFHGPQTVRSALANSYNVPAVKALQFVGIYDNPNMPGEDGVIALARRLGITTLTRDDYGLSLTLGGGEVSLLEFTDVYATLANGGLRLPPYAITRIIDHNGNTVYEYQAPPGQQVIRPEHAYLISSILSDNEARTPAFGADSVLNLPFMAAVKTGTTNDFRDNWTMGYTPDLAVGVWVGNADYTPMQNTTGLTGAAPIWAKFMKAAIQQTTGGNPTPISRPAGIIDRVICAISGTEPSQWCPKQRSEIFSADQPPLPKEQDLWTKVTVDTWTGLRASPDCPRFTKEEFALNISDPWAIKWIKENSQGIAWAAEMGFPEPVVFVPQRSCTPEDPQPLLEIAYPREGQTITTSPLDIFGQADAGADFRNFRLDFGLGYDPLEWERLTRSEEPAAQNEKIYTWELDEIPSGPITLRLRVNSIRDTFAEILVHLILQVPTPTPTPTTTPTATPTSSPTLTPTDTPTVTPTPTVSSTPTSTPEASPTPTDTPPPPEVTLSP